MTNDDLLLLQTSVFTGITTDEIRTCSPASLHGRRHLSKMRSFFLWGNHHRHRHCAGGECTHCKRGLLGQCQSDGRMCPGRYFRGSYAINSTEPLEMNIFAASTCRVLFLEVSKILTVCHLPVRFTTG